jgi:hypothetical protein
MARKLLAALCTDYNHVIQQATQEVPLLVPDRGKGKGRAADLSPCTDTRTTNKRCAQDSEERVRAALLQHVTNFIATRSLHLGGFLHSI